MTKYIQEEGLLIYCLGYDEKRLRELDVEIRTDCNTGEKYAEKALIIYRLKGVKVWSENCNMYHVNEDNAIFRISLKYIDLAIESDGKNIGFWKLRGRICLSFREYEKAIESFEKMLNIKNKDTLLCDQINPNNEFRCCFKSVKEIIDKQGLSFPNIACNFYDNEQQKQMYENQMGILEAIILLECARVEQSMNSNAARAYINTFKNFRKSPLPRIFNSVLQLYSQQQMFSNLLDWYIELLEKVHGFFKKDLELLEHLIYVYVIKDLWNKDFMSDESIAFELPTFRKSIELLDKAISEAKNNINLYNQRIFLSYFAADYESMFQNYFKACEIDKENKFILDFDNLFKEDIACARESFKNS